jgi:hypothetical protein
VGLTGGDTVQFVAAQGNRLVRSPKVGGADRAGIIFAWAEGLACDGEDFAMTFKRVAASLPKGALLVAISDWWSATSDADLIALRGAGSRLIAVQVVAPTEETPAVTAGSDLEIMDSETGAAADVTVDRKVLEDYDREYRAWTVETRDRFRRQGFMHSRVRTDADLDQLALVEWRREGIVS